MAVKFTNFVLDRFLAPHMSSFLSAKIPDLSSQSAPWREMLFLNSVVRGSYSDPVRQYVFNFSRRVEGPYTTHKLASEATIEFLDGSHQSMSTYMRALAHWEDFIAQCGMAFMLFYKSIAHDPGQPSDPINRP
jgi:hypothetical protein